MEVNKYTLDNGLRLVHVYDPDTVMVAVNVLYDVGARDERPELTGMAHLFEHLMFGGSVNVPDFDGRLSAAGGHSNAWTSSDFTNFYDVLPAVNLSTALWLESDRMLQLDFSERSLQVQQSVVVEEFKQMCLNRPYGDMDHRLREMAYRVHPYRTPVIGKDFSHIEKVTLDDVREWFYSHYGPSNAVIAICGNVPFEEAVAETERWFGGIPRRATAVRRCPAEPEQTEPRRAEASGDVPNTMIKVVYPMDGYGTQGYFEADTISDILANGRSSRFYRELLLKGGQFAEIDASIIGSEDPGLFLISTTLSESGPEAEERALKAIREQLERLKQEPPGAGELRRCVNLLESNRTFSNLNCLQVAQTAAMAEMHGEHPDDFMRPYRLHTPERISEAAARLFRPEKEGVLVYRGA